jgi:F-type H+-transporting ATPase subunit b
MDETLHALGEILLRAIPTFILVVLLHFYIKRMFFKPLEKVLKERYEVTDGARNEAESMFARASQKAAEYEAAIRATRTQIYRELEEQRHQWREEQEAAIREAKRKAQQVIHAGKENLAGDVAAARASLASDSDLLAAQIADAMFEERVN